MESVSTDEVRNRGCGRAAFAALAIALVTLCASAVAIGVVVSRVLPVAMSNDAVSRRLRDQSLPDVSPEQVEITEACLRENPGLDVIVCEWARDNRSITGLIAPSDITLSAQRVSREEYRLVGIGDRPDGFLDAYVAVLAAWEYQDGAVWEEGGVEHAHVRVLLQDPGDGSGPRPTAGLADHMAFDDSGRAESTRWPGWVAVRTRAVLGEYSSQGAATP